MLSYRAFGLSITSAFALPGLEAQPEAACPDVRFELGDVPETLDAARSRGPTWQIADNRFLLRIPSLASFLITDGRSVVAQTEGCTAIEDLSAFAGSVLGILLHQRGMVTLHASAVAVNGRAILFCGASGSGKSTLAGELDRRGYAVAADDICAVSFVGGQPTILPDGRRLKLWSEAIDALGLAARRGIPVRNRVDKYYVDPEHVAETRLPIGAIYLLREVRGPFAPGIEKPNVVDTSRALLRNAYRPLLVREMGQRRHYFEAGTLCAGQGLIHTLTRRLVHRATGEVVAWLEAHWQALGLIEAIEAAE